MIGKMNSIDSINFKTIELERFVATIETKFLIIIREKKT
jgi:hypothetical protein